MAIITTPMASRYRNAMKAFTTASLAFALLVPPSLVDAGQIYGTIILGGQGVKAAPIEIQCGKEAAVTGTTAADGYYRINVSQQGQCTLTLTSYEGRPSAAVFSGPNPAAFNYELVKLSDGKYELKRR